jgi:hypothetical protein
MYLHATGTIPDPDKLEPYWPEETRVLAELHAEGVVKSLCRLSDRPGVYLIVEADDVEEARRQVGAPALRQPRAAPLRVRAGREAALRRTGANGNPFRSHRSA